MMKYDQFWHSILKGAERAEALDDTDLMISAASSSAGTQQAMLLHAIEALDRAARSLKPRSQTPTETCSVDPNALALASEGIRIATLIENAMKNGEYSNIEMQVIADMASAFSSEINRLLLSALKDCPQN